MVERDGAVCNRQAESHSSGVAVSGGVHSKERFEKAANCFLGNAGTVVPHRHFRIGSIRFQPDFHLARGGRVADRVSHHVLHGAPQEFGISVTDVRLKRIDLPPDVSESVYRRMEAERSRVAREFRSQGAESAERIRADADRRRTEILADAYRESQQVRGAGDATASDTYAKA